MPVSVNDLRIAWIWIEAYPSSLSVPLFDRVAGCSLGRRAEYTNRFQRVLTDAKSTSAAATWPGLSLPWTLELAKRIHYFWHYYLERAGLRSVQSQDAWRKLVPLRRALNVHISAGNLPVKTRLYAFHYPHALGLVAFAEIRPNLALPDAVDMVQSIESSSDFSVAWSDGQSTQLNLPALGAEVLERIRTESFGDIQRIRTQPFKLATFVRADGVKPNALIQEYGNEHKALDGLCRAIKDWRGLQPDPFSRAKLETRRAPPSHLLYAINRSRAVWFPQSFLPTTNGPHSLGCYHNNLTCATLQTESLLQMVNLADAHPDIGDLLPDTDRLLKSAAGILGRIYGGDLKTYRSQSPRRQIDDSGSFDAINELRTFYAMDELRSTP
jgi:hypothetical protein